MAAHPLSSENQKTRRESGKAAIIGVQPGSGQSSPVEIAHRYSGLATT
jgi:hypothetical protein